MGSPWLVVSAVPVRRAALTFDAARGDELLRWLRGQVAVWPAPITIGAGQTEIHPDRLTFAPGRPATSHYCELRTDGSAWRALQVGRASASGTSPDPVITTSPVRR